MPTLRGASKRGGNSQRVVAGTLSLATFNAANDTQKMNMINNVLQRTKIDPNQSDQDAQRWLNAIGWADRTPTVVADEDALEAEKFSGDYKHGTPYLYHTDAPVGSTSDAKDFADQYFGGGKHYASFGIAGGGTYMATDWDDSLGYGHGARSAYQFKAILNNNAKIITQSNLHNKMRSMRRTHPQLVQYISRQSERDTILASMLGYNVIKNGSYYTILDRSATTVARKGYHGATFKKKGNPWKYT